jgi:hypothetical protein
MTGATSGAGTAYPSEFTFFCLIRVAQYLVFCVVFVHRSLDFEKNYFILLFEKKNQMDNQKLYIEGQSSQ